MANGGYRRSGFLLLLLAFVLHVSNQLFARPLEGKEIEGMNSVQKLVNFFFNGLGIESIVIVLVALGSAYLVVGDIANSLLSEKIKFTLEGVRKSVEEGFGNLSEAVYKGVARLEKDLILTWIKDRKGRPEDYHEIGMAGLSAFYAKDVDRSDSYLNYVVRTCLDKAFVDGDVHRRDLHSQVEIVKASSLGQSTLRGVIWRETRRLKLITKKPNAIYPLSLETKVAVDKRQILPVLRRCKLEYHINRLEVCSLQKFLNKHSFSAEQVCSGSGFSVDGEKLNIKYDGTRVVVTYRDKITLENEETEVYVKEDTYLGEEESSFALKFYKPIRGFTFDLSVHEDCKITGLEVAVTAYYKGAEQEVEIRGWPEDRRTVSVRVPNWIMPGIALIISWHSNQKK